MFYGAFPPEFNSGRMYAGPGAESMVAAAAAWDTLAAELQSTVSAYSSVIDTLSGGPWVGPSSMSMVAAVTPYLSWMQATAAQAAHTSNQATAAAAAYESAFAATVPPEEVAANRTQLASLVATNIFGQNTAAIAATEAQYAEMWAQDALAMDTYVGSAEAATSQLTAFTDPPPTTNAAASTAQAAAVGTATATPAANAAATLGSIIPPFTPANGLLGYLAGFATWYQTLAENLLNVVPNGASWYANLYNAFKIPIGLTTQFNDIGLLINFPVSQWLKFAPPVAYGALPKDALGAGLGGLGFGRGTLYNAVSPVAAGLGRGTLVGALTVPPSWASATPAIRTVAAALTAAGPEAVPAAALGEGGLLSSMSVAGMLGSAFGAGAPTVAGRATVRGRLTPLKELKDGTSPEKLKKVVAQISEKPESVQHHNVDQEGLDALLEQLAKKPGIHAVHLSKGKPKVVPSEAQMS
ncbi:PPE family protein [Mycobacterium helveticum]|uniref:PPE family protein n=1 Tax=Mycobacterium helveticum TaxID=2592811 RepID=A0A557Y0I0_9MYCO|nr:PPE family protein [Mycobacterium helveticum]TVS88944.1 PPE family protein [Mycobacterium helveticum]TVS92053.1 PPE family protein [Mycobacterium helveticum]